MKNIIIGFLLSTCMFLFMGATKSDTQVGRYDIEVFWDSKLASNYFVKYDTIEDKFVEMGHFMSPLISGDASFLTIFRNNSILEVPKIKK